MRNLVVVVDVGGGGGGGNNDDYNDYDDDLQSNSVLNNFHSYILPSVYLLFSTKRSRLELHGL